jgi:hypothetical protein
MASLHAGLSTGRLRIYTPALYDDGAPRAKEREQDRCQLQLKVRRHNEEALERLAGSDAPRRFVRSGVCVGLLDPVSNIVANALLAAAADGSSAPVAVDLRDTERNSIEGLVTFLTCFFPYLADWEAVRYLLLAEADPLVAALIVVEDRGGTKCFRSDSAATDVALKLALRCATVAAKRPQLADAWLSLCSSIDKAAPLLSALQPNHHHFKILQTLIKETAPVPHLPPTGSSSFIGKPWQLAATRRRHTTKVPIYQHSWSLRRVLLDAIHGFYLKALATMPDGSRYHRSMLKAGHCYGPFDPISNIILNTVWYEAFFPPLTPQQGEFDFVGTWSLMRVEAQSFYGLLSFICTCYQHLSVHEAMQVLLDTDLNLATATKHCSSVNEEQETFTAAATAAWYPHPNPDAQPGFLTSCKKPEILSLLSNGGQQQLSSQLIQQLATLLTSGISTQQQQQPVSVSKREFSDAMAEGSERRRAHKRISKKVKLALRRYEKQNSVSSFIPQIYTSAFVCFYPNFMSQNLHDLNNQNSVNLQGDNACYQLRVVCGANESVSGPDNSQESIMKRDDPYDDYYHHTHANFLVTRQVGSVCSVPLLFFAELSNDGDDDQLLCCPVDIPPPGAGIYMLPFICLKFLFSSDIHRCPLGSLTF